MTKAEVLAVQAMLGPRQGAWCAQQVARAATFWRAEGYGGDRYNAALRVSLEVAVIACGGLQLVGRVEE